jgi:ABC-2 type transport system permease protein
VINLLRAESIKLRTVTMNWVLGTIAIAFPLVVTLITAFVRGDDDDFTTDQLLEVLTGTSFITVLLVAVVAAASITSEFGFGTIRPTFAATPRRVRVITAKALVQVEFGLSVQIAAAPPSTSPIHPTPSRRSSAPSCWRPSCRWSAWASGSSCAAHRRRWHCSSCGR